MRILTQFVKKIPARLTSVPKWTVRRVISHSLCDSGSSRSARQRTFVRPHPHMTTRSPGMSSNKSSACVPLLLALLASGCTSSREIPRWEYTGGPYAQEIAAVTINTHDGSLLAALTSGEVFTSTNEGSTWKKFSLVRSNTAVNRLIQDPHNISRFFAVTDSGIFISTDAGLHWTATAIGNAPAHVTSRILAIDPYDANIMYAGTRGFGIYKTTDGGASWGTCNAGLDSLSVATSDVQDLVIDPLKPDRLYSAIQGIGVVASDNGGSSWTKVAAILGSGGITPTSIAIHPKTPGTFCFGMEAGNIYRTVNGGRTWSPTRVGTGSPGPVTMTVDPLHPEHIYAGTENDLLLSTDFGMTWKSIANTLPHVPTSIAVSEGQQHPALFAYGEGMGLRRSTDDGALWLPRYTGLGGSTVTAIAGDDSCRVLYATCRSSMHRWTPATESWTSVSNGLAGGPIVSMTVGADSGSIVHLATATGIFTTRDSGTTWIMGPRQLQGKQVTLISSHPTLVTRMLAGGEGEMFFSADKGATWEHAKPLRAKHDIRSLTYSPTNAALVIGAAVKEGIVTSSDGGISWRESGHGLPSADIAAVTLDDKDRKTLYAWTDQGEGFRSRDGGLAWDRYSPPWPVGGRVRIAFDRDNPSDVIALAGTDRLYYSRSGGGTWFPIPIEPAPGEFSAEHWDSQSATLYLGIKREGVYRLQLGGYLKKLFEER